jgi:transposase
MRRVVQKNYPIYGGNLRNVGLELEKLIEPLTRGDPESPLRWTCKSTYKLRDELLSLGYQISQRKVCDLLSELGYSLQSNKKTKEGGIILIGMLNLNILII